MTGSCEGHRLNKVSFGGRSHRPSSTPTTTSGLGDRRPSAAGTDKVRRTIRALCTLSSAHAVSDVESLQRLSK